MFYDKNNPTINELVHYFQVNFPALANDMKASNHNAAADEPNPYHIEDTIWTHTMMVCLRAENDNSNKIALICALLHDIGKPEARDIIPFEAKKPVHSESNELRNNGKDDGKPSGLNRSDLKYAEGTFDTMSDEDLIKKYPEQYEEFLKSLGA